jgi:hypothetical protein
MAGRAVGAAAPVAELAALLAELAAEPTALVADSIWDLREPVAVEASLDKLLMTEEASDWREEAAEEASEPTELVMEEMSEARPLVRELTRDPMSEGAPPTAEVTREMMESTWALATPAARTVTATVEKRILMIWFGLVGVVESWLS